MPTIAIVGTTTWGTTLGISLSRHGHAVSLWARTAQEAKELNQNREHSLCLPGVSFPASLTVTASLTEALSQVRMVIFAVPAQTMRDNARMVAPYLKGGVILLSVAKGLEAETGLRMSQVLAAAVPARFQPRLCVLSGPNLAREIVRGLPAASMIAAQDAETMAAARELLTTSRFYLHPSQDVVGVELGGALKNIIAIAAGMVEGLGYGDNAKAALMTRGLEEMIALGTAAGASPATFLGLAGIGDLVVTCASPLSRNHFVGQELARGHSWEQIRADMREVAEGVFTIGAARRLARLLGVKAPIAEQMHRVFFEGFDPRQAAEALLWGKELAPLKD